MSSITYRPEIDGLRALAVLPVLAFHFGHDFISGGFVGVDVFFVISGYLITSIVLNEERDGRFSIKNFMERRIRRIFPALGFLLAVLLISAPLLIFPDQVKELGSQVVSAVTCTQNIALWRDSSDYWAGESDKLVLLHLWSLSLEEQYYIVFPCLVAVFVAAQKRLKWQHVFTVLVISLLICIWRTPSNSKEAFYMLPHRAWEMASGAILAFVPSPRGNRWGWVAMIGLSGIVLSYISITSGANFPGHVAILPVLSTCLFIHFSQGNTFASRLLSSRPIVYIGKISYSLYLWHWPVVVFISSSYLFVAVPEPPLLPWCLSLLFACASYHFIESPGRRISHPWIIYIPSGIILGVIGFIYSRTPLPVIKTDLNPTYFWAQTYTSIETPANPARSERWRGITRPPVADKIKTFKPEVPALKIFLLGDSHAEAMARTVHLLAQEKSYEAHFYCRANTAPRSFSTYKPSWLRKIINSYVSPDNSGQTFLAGVVREVGREQPDLVLLSYRWDKHDTAIFSETLEFAQNLIAASPKTKIVWVEQPPVLATGNYNLTQWLAWCEINGVPTSEIKPHAHSEHSRKARLSELREHIAKSPGTFLLMTSDIFATENDLIMVIKDNNVLYFDEDHLSQAGAELIKPRLGKFMDDFFARQR